MTSLLTLDLKWAHVNRPYGVIFVRPDTRGGLHFCAKNVYCQKNDLVKSKVDF